jgi:hypothetical protein
MVTVHARMRDAGDADGDSMSMVMAMVMAMRRVPSKGRRKPVMQMAKGYAE